MAIKVGLLSATQARAYEFKGIKPDPKHHSHLKASLVFQLVGREDNGMGYLRWVGTDYRYVTEIPQRVWKQVRTVVREKASGLPHMSRPLAWRRH
jgi:hypothetical protein